jgi:radical SAM superfamily enzyme YgiQ (UPF0313 family)
MPKHSKPRLAFIAVNSSYSHTNLAAWCLQAFTRDMDWQWRTFELAAGEDMFRTLHELSEYRPDMIAATFYVFNRQFLLSLIRRYKAVSPECLVVGGGPEFMGDNREFLVREKCVNLVVRGEGEIAFKKILESQGAKRDVSDIPGVCGYFRGKYVDNGVAEIAPNLDDLPSPFECLPTQGFRKPFVHMETSRGCRGTCSFCTSGGSGKVRYRSQTRVQADLERIRASGATAVRLIDRTFNENRAHCVALLKMFRADFADFDFHLEIDPGKVGSEILHEFTAARPGQFHLEAGIQSLAPTVLKNIRRSGTPAKALAGLHALCRIENIQVHADLIAGLPGGTLTRVFRDLATLVRLKPAEIQLELLKLLPGTELDAARETWQLSTYRRKYGDVSVAAAQPEASPYLSDNLGEGRGACQAVASRRRLVPPSRGNTSLIASPEPPYEVLSTATMSAADVYTARWLCKLVDWFYVPESLREVVWAANMQMPSFWQKLCKFCMTRPGLWMQPSLVNRFKLLDEFFEKRSRPLLLKLHYAWLKRGLSEHGICDVEPWKKPVPATARLVDGSAEAAVGRMVMARLEQDYLFCYGPQPGQRAVAVYRLRRDRCSNGERESSREGAKIAKEELGLI